MRVLLTTATAAALAAAPIGAVAAAEPFPDEIALPNGWLPEGIATGTGTTIYSGSRAAGAVWKGDLRTGEGDVLVEPTAGRVAVGIKVEGGLLFVSGGGTGQAYIYDAETGAEVATLQLTEEAAFINDVVVTRDAAYFTNSQRPEIYRVPLENGSPGEPETIPLGGDWDQVAGFNANGIDATPDGKTLFVINSTTGTLYGVDPDTGVADAVETDALLTLGDGILLRGHTMYVVRNRANQIVELRMSADYTSATQTDLIEDPDFDVPTTIAAHGSELYAVNARFTTPPTPDTEYDIVKVDGS